MLIMAQLKAMMFKHKRTMMLYVGLGPDSSLSVWEWPAESHLPKRRWLPLLGDITH